MPAFRGARGRGQSSRTGCRDDETGRQNMLQPTPFGVRLPSRMVPRIAVIRAGPPQHGQDRMLINRNITVGGLRTSVRLEPEFWDSLWEIADRANMSVDQVCTAIDRSAGERSEEHTSELQSLMSISYAVFCLTKKKK